MQHAQRSKRRKNLALAKCAGSLALSITAFVIITSPWSPLDCLTSSFIGNKYDYITWLTIDACLTIVYCCYVFILFLWECQSSPQLLTQNSRYVDEEAPDYDYDDVTEEDEWSYSVLVLNYLFRVFKAVWVILGAQVFLTSIVHCGKHDPIFVFGWVYLFSDILSCTFFIFSHHANFSKEWTILRGGCYPNEVSNVMQDMSSSQ